MADDVDTAIENAEVYRQAAIKNAAREIPKGEPGECSECGEHNPRLVGGRCAFCRDGR